MNNSARRKKRALRFDPRRIISTLEERINRLRDKRIELEESLTSLKTVEQSAVRHQMVQIKLEIGKVRDSIAKMERDLDYQNSLQEGKTPERGGQPLITWT